MSNNISRLFILIPLSVSLFAQEPVQRPKTPSTTTLNSPTSQIAAWYNYAVYCESVIATRDAQLQAAQIDSAKIAAILAGITAIDAKISAPPPVNETPSAPIFTVHPGSRVVAPGEAVELTAKASGTPAPTFQWWRDRVTFPEWTGEKLTLSYVTENDLGSYTAVASSSAGTTTSTPAILSFATDPTAPPAPPVVTPTNPDDAIVGSNVTFSATAEGSPAPTFTWKKNGVVIDGATAATLQLVAVTSADSGEYVAVATNTEGAAESLPAKLNVIPAP
jgi:hypothetical protein